MRIAAAGSCVPGYELRQYVPFYPSQRKRTGSDGQGWMGRRSCADGESTDVGKGEQVAVEGTCIIKRHEF